MKTRNFITVLVLMFATFSMVIGQTQHQRGGYSQNHYRTTIDTSNVKEEVKSVVVKQIDTLNYLFNKYEALNKQHSTLKRNVTLFKQQNLKGKDQLITSFALGVLGSVAYYNTESKVFPKMLLASSVTFNALGIFNVYQSFRKL